MLQSFISFCQYDIQGGAKPLDAGDLGVVQGEAGLRSGDVQGGLHLHPQPEGLYAGWRVWLSEKVIKTGVNLQIMAAGRGFWSYPNAFPH